jgi:hypothetical protein
VAAKTQPKKRGTREIIIVAMKADLGGKRALVIFKVLLISGRNL